MRATVRDVASRARVSPKTVSNVLNGTFPVRSGTRDRVERAMHELAYVPNLTARALRNGRSGVVALALPDLCTPYSASLVHAFVLAAARRRLTIQVEESSGVEQEAELLSRSRTQLVDGMIVSSVRVESSHARVASWLPPVVMIGETEQSSLDHLWVDNVAAVRELTQLLIDRGHRRIAILGALAVASYDLRARGHREALTAAGLRIDPGLEIPVETWTTAGGAAAIAGYLSDHELPDAILCCTDSLAVGVLHTLRAAGHRVPADVSVVGYDDVPESRFCSPPLTTVHVDPVELAERALDLLARRIADPTAPRVSTRLDHRVIDRCSTRWRTPTEKTSQQVLRESSTTM